MAGGAHLIGEFPGWTAGDVLSAVLGSLGDRTTFFPSDGLQHSDPSQIEAIERHHERFRALKNEGRVTETAQLQINLPFGTNAVAELKPFSEVAQANDLAIQIIYPLWRHRGAGPGESASADEAGAAIAAMVHEIPAQCGVAIHFCCLDGASYVMSPADLDAMVAISNAVFGHLERNLDVLHFPVPLRHDNDRYFQGLAALEKRARASLCLGLLHLSDGVDGALSRVALAKPYADTFALAARCGFSKRTDADIALFLDLHREVFMAVNPQH